MKKVLLRGTVIILILFGIWLISYNQSTGCVTVAALIFIVGAIYWITLFREAHLPSVQKTRRIHVKRDLDINELYTNYANMKTPLGRPWMGSVQFVPGDVMILGPNEKGEYIYVYQKRRKHQLLIAFNRYPHFIRDWNEERIHKLDSQALLEERVQSRAAVPYLMEMLENEFTRFLIRGVREDDVLEVNPRKLCLLTDMASLNGRALEIREFDGQLLYQMEGGFLKSSMNVFDGKSQHLLLQINHQNHPFVHRYECYLKDQYFGTIHTRKVWLQKRILMKTKYGTLEMQRVTASYGEHYVVRYHGKTAGYILNSCLLEETQDSNSYCIIYAFNTSILPILSVLSVLTVQEELQDEQNTLEVLPR